MTIVQMNMELTNHFLSLSDLQISAHLVWAQIKHHFKNRRKWQEYCSSMFNMKFV